MNSFNSKSKLFRVDIPADAEVKILKHEFAGGETRETHVFKWIANGKHHRYVVQDLNDQPQEAQVESEPGLIPSSDPET